MTKSDRSNRTSRPTGAYTFVSINRRAPNASPAGRVESGVVLRGQRKHSADATVPVEQREAKVPSAPPAEAPRSDRDDESLKNAMASAMAERRYDDALSHIIGLIASNPTDPRWPHKYGDVLRMVGRKREAAAAFRRSAERYEKSGYTVRAKAMLRLADELDAAADEI